MVELRQWCPECEAATVTWTDRYGVAHCARHEPEATWKDEKEDDDPWLEDDE